MTSRDADGIRVLRGRPSHEEVAAVLAVLVGVAHASEPAPPASVAGEGASWGRAPHVTHRQIRSWKSQPT
ncbi:acyl-CoA carboxylase subunit epsilon [Streptomyces sp. NPDC057623]|uniref:acyl-CoA carboxylase subunit epsilon n=1 Tax=Streptomyces sp. NPDC057623 TaxID=3346187 RepID=UPI0036C9B2A6